MTHDSDLRSSVLSSDLSVESGGGPKCHSTPVSHRHGCQDDTVEDLSVPLTALRERGRGPRPTTPLLSLGNVSVRLVRLDFDYLRTFVLFRNFVWTKHFSTTFRLFDAADGLPCLLISGLSGVAQKKKEDY